MQSVDDLPAVSHASGPAPVPCPVSGDAQIPGAVVGRLEGPKTAWFVVLAVGGTLLAGLYPAGGPAQDVGRVLSVLLAALLWFATGYRWAKRCSVHLTPPRDGPASSVDEGLAQPNAERAMEARMLGSPAFVGAVVQGVVEKMSDEVPGKVADRLAREVMESAGDRLADAVADRIADAWQRAARTSNAAAGNGWTLRPRQRAAQAPRGRNPKA
jgi:hypothetical protein